MANPLCTYTGFGNSITGVLCNATSGNLSQPQVDSIKAQAAQDIAAASAGREPAVVDTLIQQTWDTIDKALGTFKLAGESASQAGALPSQSGFRITDASKGYLYLGAAFLVVVLLLPSFIRR